MKIQSFNFQVSPGYTCVIHNKDYKNEAEHIKILANYPKIVQHVELIQDNIVSPINTQNFEDLHEISGYIKLTNNVLCRLLPEVSLIKFVILDKNKEDNNALILINNNAITFTEFLKLVPITYEADTSNIWGNKWYNIQKPTYDNDASIIVQYKDNIVNNRVDISLSF